MSTETTFPYQDPTLSVDQRVEDLLGRLPIEDKAGLMFHPLGSTAPDLAEPGHFGMPSMATFLERRINHFNILWVKTARELAAWHNHIQRTVLSRPLGIPVTVSSDPRHSFTDNPATALMAGPFSQWPEPLGFAAIGSPELVRRWADTVRREYVAVGIRVALHPQIDLATEPRWARISTTFGEDADLTSKLAVAYVRGIQGEEVGTESVSAMAKHFPGGGPQLNGEDPHFPYGREQVYPGDNFDYHLAPFKAVIDAGVAQMMPYYGMPVGTEHEEVGFGFNKGVITDLLREKLGYDGVVCTDWGILANTCWGVEELTYEERMVKSLDAGVDQFGGEFRPQVLVDLVKAGKVTEERVDAAARRLLREKFRLGLFDHPYLDEEAAEAIVGGAEARAEGLSAQAASYVLLANAAEGPARLPLAPGGLKVYAEGLSAEALGDRATLVATPEEADVAVLRLSAPFEPRGEEGTLESFFHAGSLDFPAEETERVRRICATVPTLLDVYLDRPAILTDVASGAVSLTVNFGAAESAFVKVLFGEERPQGSLPFDLPSSMAAVEASRSDMPFDTADPLFRFGHGLRYEG
ncbi:MULTISPECIES: glycoside hydrolase family 3 protein [unclassified Streptomyces]|uniref:glycoside hydrolase family 3 protein n=1 Tax=unclassified Streptomyces TaxID=2593676 RepID=UPI001660B102|nr:MULTISPECIES: glycoside hydrolase family 3 N-terminal domain-containing protein [unclassified Streptomyces]MBD0708166.1 beta-glucosidase [Streptomyces sp. CBMA291]MBD0714524.1 beta-glucosidase [Streptomyces sp. CBMA370]